jgi:hypothetical protein
MRGTSAARYSALHISAVRQAPNISGAASSSSAAAV